MSEPTSPAACQLCGGPVSKRNTSGYCSRTPECKHKGHGVAVARYQASRPGLSAAKWAAYGPGYKERRAELDAARRQDPAFRAARNEAVKEYKARPENAKRVREYNRKGRKNYVARADRKCCYGGCRELAEVGLVFCRMHHRDDVNRRYHRNSARLRQAMAEVQGWSCPWCSKPLPRSLRRTHIDHVIPRGCGLVIEDEWNLQLLHARCNQQKSDRITPQAVSLAAAHGLTLAA